MSLNCVWSVNTQSEGVVKAFTSMDKLGHANQQNPILINILDIENHVKPDIL